jgi:hypothetical protein
MPAADLHAQKGGNSGCHVLCTVVRQTATNLHLYAGSSPAQMDGGQQCHVTSKAWIMAYQAVVHLHLNACAATTEGVQQ